MLIICFLSRANSDPLNWNTEIISNSGMISQSDWEHTTRVLRQGKTTSMQLVLSTEIKGDVTSSIFTITAPDQRK